MAPCRRAAPSDVDMLGMQGGIENNRTKIVCTIGPASSSVGTLRDMVKAGMDVARINFSHGDKDSNSELLDNIRAASKEGPIHAVVLQVKK